MSERKRGPFDTGFERGLVPGDEPPGFEEREYREWKAAGGKVLAVEEPLPSCEDADLVASSTLSQRQWFAGLAMQALISNGGVVPDGTGDALDLQVARAAYRYADAMLAQSAK